MRFGDIVSVFFSSILMIAMAGFLGGLVVVLICGFIGFSPPVTFFFVGAWVLACIVYVPRMAYDIRKSESRCEPCDLDWVLEENGQTTISESQQTIVVQRFGEGESNKRKIRTTRVYWQHYVCSNCKNESQVKCSEESDSAEF
jgi:hypothetical protein